MANCKLKKLNFGKVKGRNIQVDFNGGDITSNAGILLLKKVDQKLGLTKKLSSLIPDPRNQSYVTHKQDSLLSQRVYALALGYEDLNDHESLRKDVGFQTAVNSDKELASAPTLCRFENRVNDETILSFHKELFCQFVHSFSKPPAQIVLDFDATDDLVHGKQEGSHYHGYYGNTCFLPLHVYSGEQLLVNYLRPGNCEQAKHAGAIFFLLVKAIRKVWPEVKIVFRGDCGFNKHKMFDWIEKQENVFYLVGQAKNNVINQKVKEKLEEVAQKFEESKEKQKEYCEFEYKASTWSKERRIIAKLEVNEKGPNVRCIISNLPIEEGKKLYEDWYCKRGEMENHIKEQQLHLFSDRTSCQNWWANQFRLMLSGVAYILMQRLREMGLKGTELAKAEVETIRLKLLKIGAVIIRNTRKVKFHLSSAYPKQDLFERIFLNLGYG